MFITILRHGKPEFNWARSVKGSEIRSLEKAYDSAGIVDEPPVELQNLAGHHNCVVCSDLLRSIQSAQAVGATKIHFSESTFREMNIPYFANIPIKLPVKVWVSTLRILWFLGLSKNTESISVAKSRAKFASEKLIDLASEHESVLFVGHGILNHADSTLKCEFKITSQAAALRLPIKTSLGVLNPKLFLGRLLSFSIT